jgi:hypothetical protein
MPEPAGQGAVSQNLKFFYRKEVVVEKRINPWTYFLGIAVGVTGALFLSLKLFSGNWPLIVLSCLAGVIIGLFVVDHRAMIKICRESGNVFSGSLRERIGEEKWQAMRKNAKFPLFFAVRMICLSACIGLTFLLVNIWYPGIIQTRANGNFVHQGAVALTLAFSLMYFAVVWAAPYVIGGTKRPEAIMFRENMRYLLFFWLFALRGTVIGIIVFIFECILLVLFFPPLAFQQIRKHSNLLAALICIVSGEVVGIWQNSILIGFSVAMALGVMAYVSNFAWTSDKTFGKLDDKFKSLLAKVPAPKLIIT